MAISATYPVSVRIEPAYEGRNRLTTAFRLTGRFPQGPYRFGVGVLQRNIRVEAYVLLLHDDYPPFSLE